MKSFILSVFFLLTLSSTYGWTAGPTHEKQFEGNGVVFVEKQVEGFVHVETRGVYSDEDKLLMVEVQNIIFLSLSGFASLDSSLQPPALVQCFPEDRFEGGVFIRESSCNNGYGTTWCSGNKCVGYFIYTDDLGQPTGRTALSIQSLDNDHKKAKLVRFDKLDGEEICNIVGIVEEKQ